MDVVAMEFGMPSHRCVEILGKVVARNGIADEQDAREIGFVRVGNPDVAPLKWLPGQAWLQRRSKETIAKKGLLLKSH